MPKGKMIYDGKTEVNTIEEDLGLAITESKSERGKWPSCFGGESLRPPNPPLSPPYGEKKCTCGKHTMFWLRAPKEIWPDSELVFVRVFEEG
ncbi:hypothetical protein KJA13_03795 [Patescibacteria group bacterium]|nr:hypothetical protein [Patescibacteria group bacterium]